MNPGETGGPASPAAVCAVVVTFHPDSGLPARIARVLRQTGAIVIVDNGSNEDEIAMLRGLAENSALTLVLNAANLGVASALNIGIRHAVEHGASWVLLLDQDSCVNEDMLNDLWAVRAAHPTPTELAVVGAGFTDVNEGPGRGTATVGDLAAPSSPWDEVQYVITSGSLIPLATHAVVGPFREDFFIDHVDMEYCLRARAKGFRVLRTRKPLMSHAIGAYTPHRWLWMTKWTTNHSPDRRYYIARNDTVMLREYGRYAYGLWALKSFARCCRLCKRIALYEHRKVSKVAAVAQGWWDGVRGRLGPRPGRR